MQSSLARPSRARLCLATLLAPLAAVLVVEIALITAGWVASPDWFGVAMMAPIIGGPVACVVAWVLGVPLLLAMRAVTDRRPTRAIAVGLFLGATSWVALVVSQFVFGPKPVRLDPALVAAAVTASSAGAFAGWTWWCLAHPRRA